MPLGSVEVMTRTMAIPIACTMRHATSIAMKNREMNLADRHPPFSDTLPTRAT